MKPFGRVVLILLLVFAAPPAVVVRAQVADVPNGELTIAYRQRQEGKLSQAVFQNYLRCFDGRCTLTTLTLNQCIAGKFYPKIQQWATDDNTLSVTFEESVALPRSTQLRQRALTAEFYEQGSHFRMRFEFLEMKSPITGGPWMSQVQSFSGGVVKDSTVLGKIITWDLVPLDFWQANAMRLDCPVLLDGIVQ